MSSPSDSPQSRRWSGPLILALGVGLAVGLALWVAPQEVRGAIAAGIARIQSAGPGAFFVAMAFVPAPLAWYTIPAGEAFAAELTLPGVIAAALAAAAVQISLCYWLGRSLLRPWLERWLASRGQEIPRVTTDNALSVVVMVRLVPGAPLPLQCALLGLARVPFRIFLTASWLITVPWVIGGVVLGRGFLGGNLGLGAIGLSVLGAAACAVHLFRRRLAAGARP